MNSIYKKRSLSGIENNLFKLFIMEQFFKRKNSNLVVLVICIVSFGFIVQGCQKDDENFNKDSEITTSIELENYIIAASDLHQSLKIFKNELVKIDFSKLETVIENGRKVTYLPTQVRSLNIEKKVLLLKQKKDALLNKYPQVCLQDFNDFTIVANHCIQQSTRINDFFLDKNIYFNQPLTRAVVGEWSFDSPNALVGHLYNWVLHPDYVEVYIVFFTDGSNLVVLDDRNGTFNCELSVDPEANGGCSYNGKLISGFGHTHSLSPNPSTEGKDNDMATKAKFPNLEHFIFYNGAFWAF